ncbi:unnamed protein product [Ascophyllum nodosum]
MLMSDSPQRAQLLYCKAPNKSTPCPACLVSQTEPDGGELCDPNCPIYDKMRSRKYQDRVQKESTKLPRGSTAAKKLSTKTDPFGLRSFTGYGHDEQGRAIYRVGCPA